MGIGHNKHRVHKEGCCDCGLVHDVQYRVVTKVTRRGKRVWVSLDMRKCKIEKRVRLNRPSTAAMRRAKRHARVKKALKGKN